MSDQIELFACPSGRMSDIVRYTTAVGQSAWVPKRIHTRTNETSIPGMTRKNLFQMKCEMLRDSRSDVGMRMPLSATKVGTGGKGSQNVRLTFRWACRKRTSRARK